jgi:hypothetical protein
MATAVWKLNLTESGIRRKLVSHDHVIMITVFGSICSLFSVTVMLTSCSKTAFSVSRKRLVTLQVAFYSNGIPCRDLR